MTEKLGRLWAGRLFGTNIGNVAAELNQNDEGVSGRIRFLDAALGPVVYEVAGSFDGTNLDLRGEATQVMEGVQAGEVQVEGSLTPDGSIRGEWSSEQGTGGTFVLFPHDNPTPATAIGAMPEQLHTVARTVGAVRLVATDVRELVSLLAQDFASQPRVVITYRDNGSQVSRYASAFLSDFDRLSELRYLKLSVQEPDVAGINRIASVELTDRGSNEIFVQGAQLSWTRGKAESLASHLQLREKFLITSFRRFGLNINGFMFLIALAFLPELPLLRRLIFIAILAALIVGLAQFHSRYVPNAVIFLSDRPPHWLRFAGPQLASWMSGVASAVTAATAYGMLKGDIRWPF